MIKGFVRKGNKDFLLVSGKHRLKCSRQGHFFDAGETPEGCHLSNRGYLLMKRAKRVKWQAPTVLQSTHVVAGGEPNTHDRQGVAFSDILLYWLTRGDADPLAPLDCRHYHGLLRGSPVGRD